MKKMIGYKHFMLIAVIFGLSVSPILADTNAEGDLQESKANVSFKKDTTAPITPVDPVDPVDPSQPGDGGGTGSKGDFTIDVVPTLDFGEIEVKTGDTVKNVYSTTQKPYVQVSDRRLTGEGWNLKAQLSDFTHTNGTNKISGASIKFQNGSVKKVNSNSDAPSLTDPVVIDSTSKTVMSAAVNTGLGTWIATWINGDGTLTSENQKVELEIPVSDVVVGDYSADITWTLSKQP